MRWLRLLIISGVATVASAAGTLDPKVSPRIATGVVTSIRQYFRSDCVYFITSNSLGERHHVVSTQKMLGQQKAIFTKILPYQTLHLVTTKLRSFCNIPIYVMFSDNDDIRTFLMGAAAKIRLASSVWLLFMMTNATVEAIFKDAYIPFDTEFIVSQKLSDDLVQLIEVYRVMRGGALTQYSFSSYTVGKGMTTPVEGLYQRRGSLDGMVVRSADIHSPPISLLNTSKDNVTDLSGFSGEVWKILEQELNFSTKHMIPTDGGLAGIPVNKTVNNVTSLAWDGMVSMLLNDECDVTSSATTMTTERGLAVSFTLPVFTSKFVVYMKKPDRKAVNWSDWTAPFSPRLWAAFVFQTIVSAILMVFVSWLVRHFGSNEGVLSLYDQVFLSYGAIICQQGQEETTPKSWSCRILFFIVYLSGVILAASYSGSIISNLTVFRLDLPFDTLEGLLEHGGYHLGTRKVSFIFEIFRTAENGLFRELFTQHMINDPANLIENNLLGFKRVCDKNFAFISNPESASLFRDHLNCTIVNLPQVFVKYTNSFMLPKHSPYLDLFNNKLLKLTNDGALRKIYRKYMFKEEPIKQNVFNSIVLEDVTPMLVIVVGGILAGWLLVALEHVALDCLIKHPMPEMSTVIEKTKTRIREHIAQRGLPKNRAVQRRQLKKSARATLKRSWLPKRLQ